MGQIVLCKCSGNGCTYEKKLFCGAGMGAKNIAVIEKNVPKSVFESFSAKLEAGAVSEFRLENKAALCGKCGEIFSAAVFAYKLSDGGGAEYISPCPECGGDVRVLTDTENTVCPKCGGKMSVTSVGRWD